MALRTLEKYGSPILREKAKPVTDITEEIVVLAQDMLETMHAFSGIGLAGNQVGVPLRIITVLHPETQEGVVVVNPEIVVMSAEKEVGEEGCLSIPEVYGKVERASQIVVRGWNLRGEEVEIKAQGLLARVFQHEIDHLNGILFVDRLHPAKRLLLSSKLRKIAREGTW
ncbi:MAG: peptide deformylase [Candidatus Caldatribacterium sp.]|uniref:peptide deformylase n=1 Tax=Candidatus Caldatribacterium sp. TaxID=2282143 RepID=UPI002995663F|nr:peptide deformylase [Candidatus Caldatribacterium sp.]MCX7730481.1 peptide deformylase [Candidatus Caldatribacterium sp.]MDW8080469.1 peptide deformylase [Candidatus Calescibacterium sp.]